MNGKARFACQLALGLCALPALAQATASQNFTATVQILTPISWAKTADLNFGAITAPTAGSADMTLVLKASDASRTYTGGDGALVTGITATTPTAAAATLTSEAAYQVDLTLTGSYTDLASGLTLSAATVNVVGGSVHDVAIPTNYVPAAGTQDLTFGATVLIPKGTSTGTKGAGAFSITATYH